MTETMRLLLCCQHRFGSSCQIQARSRDLRRHTTLKTATERGFSPQTPSLTAQVATPRRGHAARARPVGATAGRRFISFKQSSQTYATEQEQEFIHNCFSAFLENVTSRAPGGNLEPTAALRPSRLVPADPLQEERSRACGGRRGDQARSPGGHLVIGERWARG